MENLPMSVRIGRASSSTEDDYMILEVEDREANVLFLRLKMSLGEFANVITNRTGQGTADVRGLECIGKVHQCKTFVFELPKDSEFRSKEAAREAVQEACPEGWTPDTCFNSQSSFFREGDKQYARTFIRRWVEKENENS